MLAVSLCHCGNGSPPPPAVPDPSAAPATAAAPPSATTASAETAAAAPTAAPPAAAPPAAAAASGGEAKPSAAQPATTGPVALPALPKGTKVLHVGDSMAQALAPALARELNQRGITCVMKVKEATYIPEWAGFKWGFAGLIAHYDPDLVIITLGGNEVAMPDPSIRAEPVRRLVATVGDRPCIWIKAPLWGPHTGVMDVIRDNCAPCRWVDTDELLPSIERLDDGIHPTIPERKRWAHFMVRWLAHNLAPTKDRPFALKAVTSAPPAEGEVMVVEQSEHGKLINIRVDDK